MAVPDPSFYYFLIPLWVKLWTMFLCRKGYSATMGTLTLMVMVARMARGGTVFVVPAAALDSAWSSDPDMVFALCRTFISSYC